MCTTNQHSYKFFFISRVFGLLPNKETQTYKRFWEALFSLGKFRPLSIGLDFEKAISNSFQLVFGEDVEVYYCLFHLTQNYLLKIFENHKGRYQSPQEKEFAERCRMVPALAFLPKDDVAEVFEELLEYDKNHPELPNLLPPEVVTYFEKTYIGKKLRNRNDRGTPR